MTGLPEGLGGTLFPHRYLCDCLPDAAGSIAEPERNRRRAHLLRWWTRVAASCGPATACRALFDVAAMPLFGALGFRAAHAVFDRAIARCRLTTPRGEAVALLVLPWAARPSTAWRSAVVAARDAGAEWCFVFAPPFLSLVSARGPALRRGFDASFPEALGPAGFPAFFALTRAGAFDRAPGGRSPLETLVADAASFQDRVRSDLEVGVVEALAVLTPVIGSAGAGASLPFEEALTVLYRVLFLLFAESRDLVPHRHPIYRQAYALGTLWRQAPDAAGAAGLWEALAAVTRLSRTGCRLDDLIVRPFNGRLFARAAAPTLEARGPARRPTRASLARDRAMQRTLVALATRPAGAGREEISYSDLGVEQLGAVYERVLDLDPRALPPPAPPGKPRRHPAGTPQRHSGRRKRSGTFYTPQDLAELVVRRTLAPLLSGRSAESILALRVVDPAMGSGAFLVAACRYLAAAYERALIDEGRCSEADIGPVEQAGMRRLIAERCLAGVDVNPIAVQLARLSLWLATLAEGKPLGFLDHRLRVGNSLIGASPEDLRRAGRPGHGPLPLLEDLDLERSLQRVARPLLELTMRRDETVEDVRAKEAIWSAVTHRRAPLAPWRRAADLWCARWFWPGDGQAGRSPSPAELRAAIDALVRNDSTLRTAHLSRWLSVAAALGAGHRFFHWPLEFADVFYDAEGRAKEPAGFDAVIGNPPWEMLRQDPETGDGRRGGPAAGDPRPLSDASPNRRQFVRFIRESGLYPSCDRGHVNLYQPFLERALSLARPGGRVGLVLPWGLAADEGAAALRGLLLDRSATDTIVGIDNSNGIFPIHRSLRFLVVVAAAGGRTREIRARFGLETREEIAALSEAADGAAAPGDWPVRLTPAVIDRVGGPARRIPDVRRAEDLEWLERLVARHPPLGASAGWDVRFGRELNITDDRGHFGERGLPVLEGKHVQPFVTDPHAAAFRIARADAIRRLPSRDFEHPRLAYRDVSGVSNRLSLIAAIVPGGVVTSHTLFCLRTNVSIERQHFLCGLFNSFVLNAVVRLLMGGHLTTSLVESLPAPPWTGSRDQRFVARLAARLARRSDAPLASARLQAAVARLYDIDAAAFAILLSGFPLVPERDKHLALASLGAV